MINDIFKALGLNIPNGKKNILFPKQMKLSQIPSRNDHIKVVFLKVMLCHDCLVVNILCFVDSFLNIRENFQYESPMPLYQWNEKILVIQHRLSLNVDVRMLYQPVCGLQLSEHRSRFPYQICRDVSGQDRFGPVCLLFPAPAQNCQLLSENIHVMEEITHLWKNHSMLV